MKNENLSNKLKVAISILEKKQTSEFNELRTECEIVLNEFKPLNMMGQVSKFITSDPNIKNNLFNAVLSLGLGYVSKKFIPKKINSLLSRITQFASNLKMA